MPKSYADWTDDELEAAARMTTLVVGKPAEVIQHIEGQRSKDRSAEPDSVAITLEEIKTLRQEQQALLGQVATAVRQLGTAVAWMQETSGRLAASTEKEVLVTVAAPKGIEDCVAALRVCASGIAKLVAKEPPAPPVVPPTPPAEHPIQVNVAAAEPPPPPLKPWGERIRIIERDANGATLVAEKQILYEAPDASD